MCPDHSILERMNQEYVAAFMNSNVEWYYRLEQVHMRVYGDAALVQATGLWTRRDGSKGMSRYIDVYVRHNCEWKTVSAQMRVHLSKTDDADKP